MGTTTTTFALNKPTVGGDDNAWGTDWNTNADKLDDLLDGTTAIKPNLSEGLWKVGGVAVTATAAELNLMDGVTASTAELNFVDGVTSAIQTQLDGKQASDATLTNLSGLSLAAGDVLYATAADTLQRLAIGTAGQSLRVNSGATAPSWGAQINLGTSVASTSGTSIDFTGIPAWARRVTLFFSGVSTNGASNVQIQIGDSGGFEVSGYLGGAAQASNGNFVNAANNSSGFLQMGANIAASTIHGSFSMVNIGSNTWVGSGASSRSDAASVNSSGGSKQLSDTLTQVRITTVSGTDTFDAGSINISWE